jgi:DNA-binding transcriptional LysR family regulator
MSMSNASQRLTNLELSFGTQLFLRDHRGLNATEAGSVFVAYGRAILQTIDQLNDRLASLNLRDAGGTL